MTLEQSRRARERNARAGFYVVGPKGSSRKFRTIGEAAQVRGLARVLAPGAGLDPLRYQIVEASTIAQARARYDAGDGV